ncbi:MAG: 3-deoxy-manno-octulosonate cytidylyltransferase [Gammaproteobacteria bacterium]|nr:3-deoxy-manno-octulosonate cytidylyltransferase [Gammaproteobacteria bacterium]
MTEFAVVVPARYASTRLPGKPLADIAGRPMVAWVHEQARRSGAAEVLIATDDARIAEACGAFGARVEMTAAGHASGTDRIAELARRLGWEDSRIVVNVQGDEPLLPPALIAQVAALLDAHAEAAVATLMTPIASDEEFRDPNIVKVVTDRDGHAIYFSRAPIPWPRDGATGAEPPRRHVGLYAYRVGELKRISAEAPCGLETTERLEQLRALWLGYRIAIADAVEPPPRGVDTPDDLDAVREAVARSGHGGRVTIASERRGNGSK